MKVDESKKKIQDITTEIESKYGFKSDFNLAEKLKALPTEINQYKKRYENYPRLSEKKKSMNKSLILSKKLYDEIKKTATQTLIDMQEIPQLVAEKTGFLKLQEESAKWNIFQFKEDLRIFNQNLLYAKTVLEKDVGGRKSNSEPKYLIFLLVMMYENGTELKPTCGWNDADSSYTGAFFDFINDIKPILIELKLNIGGDGTIGKYAVEAIRHYKESLNKLKSDELFLKSLLTHVN